MISFYSLLIIVPLLQVFSQEGIAGNIGKNKVKVCMLRLKVKEFAKEKGFSMGKLSRAADVDLNTMRRMYDDRKYSPTVETLFKVAKVLGVTLDDLVEEILSNDTSDK